MPKSFFIDVLGVEVEIIRDDDGFFVIPEKFRGTGTSLKPAWEPIMLFRKPIDGTVAANILKHGVGGLNIDGCRIGTDQISIHGYKGDSCSQSYKEKGTQPVLDEYRTAQGRWPANLVLSHSEGCRCVGTKKVKSGVAVRENSGGNTFGGEKEKPPMENMSYADSDGMEEVEAWECAEGCPIRLMDEQSGARSGCKPHIVHASEATRAANKEKGWGSVSVPQNKMAGYDDSGGASRFFANFQVESRFLYTSKASKQDRDEGREWEESFKKSFNTREEVDGVKKGMGADRNTAYRNTHPTVKSTALMKWLCRLITPPGGTCLDPFMGSGSTGKACMLEGFNFIGIEQDAEYCKIAEARIRYAQNNAGKELEKKKPAPRKPPTTPKAPEQPAPEKPAPKQSAQVSIFEIDKS